MAKNEFAAIITNINNLIHTIENEAPDEIAKLCLDATYYDVPRPPWNTGQLRSSGVAFVGGRQVAKTPLTGPNPKGPMLFRDPEPRTVSFGDRTVTFKTQGGFSTGSATSTVYNATRININKFRSGSVARGKLPNSVVGNISIVYQSPVAALMHEWDGGFSDAESGKHYITAKLPHFMRAFTQVMRRIF